MKKIFYEKVGRKYIPTREYDSDLLDSLPYGSHLIMCYPGGSSRRYSIEPNYAAMIAAGRIAEDAICSALLKASEVRMKNKNSKKQLTLEQAKAWENLVDLFGPDARQLEWASTRELAEAGVKAMQQEADLLMSNPAVRKAFEYFQTVCDLTREQNVK